MVEEVYEYRRRQAYELNSGKRSHPKRGANGSISSIDGGWLAVGSKMTPSSRITPDIGSRLTKPVGKGRGNNGDSIFESPLR